MKRSNQRYNTVYTGDRLNRIAFPMGGIGAGMICLEGTGAFSHVSLRHKPEVFNEPLMFAALHVNGAPTARALEGPVPMWKAFGQPGTGNGAGGRSYGLPRFAEAAFTTRFPFGIVDLKDSTMPVDVRITGWSPFLPGHADDSSLPVAGLEYRFRNRTRQPRRAIFSFHAANFLRSAPGAGAASAIDGGFLLDACGGTGTNLSDFVRDWQITPLPAGTTLARARPLSRADAGAWRPIAAASDGFVNVHATELAKAGVVCLTARLEVRTAAEYTLLLGHDGGARLFIDGRELATVLTRQNPAAADRTRAATRLDRGEHEITLLFDTAGGDGWGIYFRLAVPVTAGPDALVHPGPGWDQNAWFAAFTDEPGAVADCAWFRGGWFDSLTMLWKTIAGGARPARPPHPEGDKGAGASLYVPFELRPGAAKTLRLMLSWYAPTSDLLAGADARPAGACGCDGACETPAPATYRPWYAARFASVQDVVTHWRTDYDRLRTETERFARCFYDTTLPAEAVEAVAANLTILKSPTCLRQADGRFWAWEGCSDATGCCHGTCTHVWNYAQALPHLFPALERSLRETEFGVSQDERGHQNFRASLPIRPPAHDFHAAADGQLGGIIKVYRDWRISGDTAWMRSLWPRVRQSLDYCIATWDPDHTGTLVEPHHNTYDIEFWGADGMCTSFYLSALQAAILMGQACGTDVAGYELLRDKGRRAMQTALWNGAYFFQNVQWKGLRAADPVTAQAWNTSYSPEARAILDREGPKYQYGAGCLADGVLGDWLARVSGLPTVLDSRKVAGHVASVYRHNYRASLADHANPQRPGYAFGREGGLVLCTWPRGGKPSLPFPYSDEVWTGFEYQVAAHLILMGRRREGLQIVRSARDRYDGRYRNPFDEYECGHWYARAMSSYALLQALSGARYDAVEKTLYLNPRMPGDFRAFLSAATGYGTVGVRKGQPFFEVKSGSVAIDRVVFRGKTIAVKP